MVRYDVLLSRPPRNKPNVVQIIDVLVGRVVWNVTGPEKASDPLLLLG